MCVFFVMYILKNYLYTFLYLPDFWQCAYTVLIYFHYSFKMSLKEKVGGYWRVLCADSALSSAPHPPPPSVFHSPHSWGPSPPLGCSILCLNLSCFSTSLSLFPSVSLWPVPFCDPLIFFLWVFLPSCLLSPSSFWDNWHSHERSNKCYFAPGRF